MNRLPETASRPIAQPRRLHLGIHISNSAVSAGTWESQGRGPDTEHYIGIAKAAEGAALDAVFLTDLPTPAEGAGHRPGDGPEPTVVLAAMAAETRRIGLVATASTTGNEPYDIARRFATLDLLSGGRSGWHMATAAAAGSGPDAARDGEFVAAVRTLWNSWEEGALVGDRGARLFVDTDRIHPARFHGEHFAVEGPLNTPRSPQGEPVRVRAAASPDGWERAAAHAEVVVTAARSLEEAHASYAGVKSRAAALGRDPDAVVVLAGLRTVIGSTESEAKARRAPLDERARGRPIVTGTPEQVTDTLEIWFRSGAADGFTLTPDVLPDGLHVLTEHVVPELRRRGLFRREYDGSTLRAHLGLPVPVPPRPAGSAAR
ncbi:LLM class flavin-dependent oxidoreductase [Streptomyces shenzhenensis]|uniref:LLM class flavin-dependent oxidoreductase n=1 Tax=Streptomyces shenzhenensis TaxID=943815 RepID=UPI00381D8F8B